MDFLNRAFEQIKDLFASMTPGARITAGLLLVVIVVSLVFLMQGGFTAGDNYLLGGRGFSTAELEAMEGAFAKAGLSNYQLEGNQVRIPSANKSEYIAALAENDALPNNFSKYFGQQANSSSVFETKEQAAQRWRLAKQQELALIISKMNGIAVAQVIYDESSQTGFPRRSEKTATVAAQAIGNGELELHQIKAIRHLVSSSIAGLKYQSVMVTDLNTGKHHGSGEGELAGVDESIYINYKRSFERDWTKKIENALSFVPGAVVTVDVELTDEMLMHEESVTVDQKPVAIRTQTTEKVTSSNRMGVGGRPGITGQNGAANQQASIGGGEAESTSEEASENVERLGGHGRKIVKKAPLTPRKVTVAVAVPNSYYMQIWQKRNPPADGEEPRAPEPQQLLAIENSVVKDVEDTVVDLIPKVDTVEDKYPRVVVKSFENLTKPPEELPGMAHTAGVWVSDNWSTLGMLLVGAFGLLMFRGLIKQRPTSPSGSPNEMDENSPNLSIVGGEDDAEDDEEESPPKKRFASSGVGIKDELADMVRENPDAAANILRSWIGEAS